MRMVIGHRQAQQQDPATCRQRSYPSGCLLPGACSSHGAGPRWLRWRYYFQANAAMNSQAATLSCMAIRRMQCRSVNTSLPGQHSDHASTWASATICCTAVGAQIMPSAPITVAHSASTAGLGASGFDGLAALLHGGAVMQQTIKPAGAGHETPLVLASVRGHRDRCRWRDRIAPTARAAGRG